MELKTFLRAASKRERADVATVCSDSVSYLYQLAGQHRYASALMATRIEEQTRAVAAGSHGRLAAVPRDSLVRYPEIFERPVQLMVAEERP
jgi:NCAIR mutase (PurE)-related protein